MSERENGAPALPGEVWRGEWDGCVWAVDDAGNVHVWWPAAGRKWDAHPAPASEVTRALREWAMAERAARVKAETRLRQWSVAANGMSPRGLWAQQQGLSWQCSGCGYVERAHRCAKACPSCKREGYMCGSVSSAARTAHDEAGFAKALAEMGIEP